MEEILHFSTRGAFREWLQKNGASSEGVWLLFGKKGGPATLSAAEALEEALCFGWIDGQMQSLDKTSYKKYFARRRPGSNWSEKNKALAEKLEKQGIMAEQGKKQVTLAKQNGQWSAPKPPGISEEQIEMLSGLLKGHEPAYRNFLAMPPSVKKHTPVPILRPKPMPGETAAWHG